MNYGNIEYLKEHVSYHTDLYYDGYLWYAKLCIKMWDDVQLKNVVIFSIERGGYKSRAIAKGQATRLYHNRFNYLSENF